jgi:hypothetical protein
MNYLPELLLAWCATTSTGLLAHIDNNAATTKS